MDVFLNGVASGVLCGECGLSCVFHLDGDGSTQPLSIHFCHLFASCRTSCYRLSSHSHSNLPILDQNARISFDCDDLVGRFAMALLLSVLKAFLLVWMAHLGEKANSDAQQIALACGDLLLIPNHVDCVIDVAGPRAGVLELLLLSRRLRLGVRDLCFGLGSTRSVF